MKKCLLCLSVALSILLFAGIASAASLSYTITYKLSDGINHPENPSSYTIGDVFEFKEPTKVGNVFAGWYTSTSYKTPFPGITAEMKGKKTVTAKWIPNQYNVSFDGNGAQGETVNQQHTYGKSISLTKNRFSRFGYSFIGWNTDPDGHGISYKNGQKVRNLSTQEDLTLYAQWRINVYSLVYHLNGGTNDPANPKNYTVENVPILADPVRIGYVFQGWFLDSKYKKPCETLFDVAGKTHLYAKWTKNTYTVVFHSNIEGNDTITSVSLRDGESKTLPQNQFAFANHCFMEWNTQPDGSGASFSDKQNMRAFHAEHGETIDLYAIWKAFMKVENYRGVPYMVIDTKGDPIAFSEISESVCCEMVDFKKYHGKCLSFAYYHASCLLKGITNTSIKNAAGYKANGCHFRSRTYKNEKDLLKRLYTELNNGKPVILMVKSTDRLSRHFVTCVGYKASVQGADTISETDLLIIDSMDGKLEAMDPAIFSDNPRVLHKQKNEYRLVITG